jgi:hypothetical protein
MKPTDQTRKLSERDEAVLAFGKAMAAWPRVERGFYLWFEHVTLLDYQQCNPLYYSVQTFRARLDLLRAALECNAIEKDELEFIETAMKVVQPYNSLRNKLAHGEFTLDGLVVDSKSVGREDRLASIIDLGRLKTFTNEANELATLMGDARDLALGFADHNDPDASLARCLARIRELQEAQKGRDRQISKEKVAEERKRRKST